MDFEIREAHIEDMDQVSRLVQELADFEKESHEVEVTAQHLRTDGFGDNPLFHCFVAEKGDKIVGIALVYPRYSTWKGPVIHLEDLIVTQEMRGKGLGSALLDAVVHYAAEQKVKRVSWEVLDWNEPAIQFYESKGAKVMRDWDVVQLNANGIQSYLKNIED
ncbi:MAG: GNAT family N-acetyltransferase [Bacteroidota bacterium]